MFQSRFLADMHRGYGIQEDAEVQKTDKMFTSSMMANDNTLYESNNVPGGGNLVRVDLR